jgi:hypothetical protein
MDYQIQHTNEVKGNKPWDLIIIYTKVSQVSKGKFKPKKDCIPQWFCIDYVNPNAGVCVPLANVIEGTYQQIAEIGIKTMQQFMDEKILTVKFYNNEDNIMAICGQSPFGIPTNISEYNRFNETDENCTCMCNDRKFIGISTDENCPFMFINRKDNLSPTPKEAREVISEFKKQGIQAFLMGEDKKTKQQYIIDINDVPLLGYKKKVLLPVKISKF